MNGVGEIGESRSLEGEVGMFCWVFHDMCESRKPQASYDLH
jgi:hypothetical protein